MNPEATVIHRFANGDFIQKQDHALVACFSGRRKVLSTAPHNGGCRENLRHVFNQDCNHEGCTMKAATYAEHMAIVTKELGLDPATACGLSTAAQMENVSIQTRHYAETAVTAVVTGGIDINGGRVGDPADWHETEGQFVHAPGTINILLFIDADLAEGAMARALVTCTEAKTAAIQELLAPSCYSSGIATGSGTDGTIIIANADSPVRLSAAGKHSKLGELIGRTVMAAVKEALYLQTGLCPASQFNVFRRLGRFGLKQEMILPESCGQAEDERLAERLAQMAVDPELVIAASLYAHLLDQLQWGLITAPQARKPALRLLESMGMAPAEIADETDSLYMIKSMVDAYARGLRNLVFTGG